MRNLFIAVVLAVMGLSTQAYASDPVPVNEAPYASTMKGVQLAADPASVSMKMDGEWRADVRGGGYIAMTITVSPNGILAGTYKAVLVSGTREMVFGKDVHGKIVGGKLMITFVNGTYEGTLQGSQFIGQFTAGPNAPPNLKSGPVTYRKL